MASNEDNQGIQVMLRQLMDELQGFKATQVAYNTSNTERMDRIDARLTALETRSRPASPIVEPTVERKTTFVPPSRSSSPQPAATPAPDSPPLFGLTGLPFTPAPGKEERPERNRRPDRRDTIHLHNLKTAEASSQRPFVQATLAPYDHITYKKTSIAAFLKFWDEVISYEQRHGTTFQLLPRLKGLCASASSPSTAGIWTTESSTHCRMKSSTPSCRLSSARLIALTS
jgi:hypothetical protein